MKEYRNDRDAFDKICGNCEGVNIEDISEDDIRNQAEYYNVDDEWIQAALRGLADYSRR